ncbi:FdhF/YdeP family oxidoreductase [Falsiroseomonas sp. HW251]|uniref:FdhF/YdeP family oxidoreductase n=1 Tax=Falsiroseomonas sp. HW251 TaxID=3390998 RepID=UPI003D3148DC
MAGPSKTPRIEEYEGPAGGYGSLRAVGGILLREEIPGRIATLQHQNKPDGYMCVSCSWAKPPEPLPFEYCENGAKATAWETTRRRVEPDFFQKHSLAELEGWLDYHLEEAGRLTEPMRWDPATDRYLPVSWESAFEEIGRELGALRADPDQVIFYTSGRASLEASYMFQLLARLYGTNNLPDSSNMCHESTSVALPESIGAPVGTITLQDFDQTDLILYLGHNIATTAPRMLHQFQHAKQRGATIISVNPLRERGLERFTDPQSPREMLTGSETQISDAILQVRVGGDLAALTGICKALIAMDDAAGAGPTDKAALREDTENDAAYGVKAAAARATSRRVLDHDFIAAHTTGFDALADHCRSAEWAEIEHVSGLSRSQLEEVAATYARADRCMALYGMGLTQHVGGVETVQMLANLLLLRGNIGKPGTGICPVRGHSNVQGQRTVGITEKPDLVPLDRLEELYGFKAPRHEGYSTVAGLEAMLAGKLRAFVALGGNVVRAAPDQPRVEAAWRKLRLTVAIATKLNRSHVVHGEIAYLLPCLGRLEIDEQASGPQMVSIESSVAQFHGSWGQVKPASDSLRSEPAIIAGIAQATLPPNPRIPWQDWVGDYGLVRDAIERTWPTTFTRFNERIRHPGGFPRPLAARERSWSTHTGKANFLLPTRLFAGAPDTLDLPDVLQLTTFRSNDQFNTTIYGYHDRFRGVRGTRLVVFMNQADIARLGLEADAAVDIETALDTDGAVRRVEGFRVLPYDIPPGCCGAYFPEANPLVPLSHRDTRAHTPAYKAIPVRVTRSRAAQPRIG